MSEKCIVFGCTNKKGQGSFVGDICVPCYKIITEGDLKQPSTNFIHKLAQENKRLRNITTSSTRQPQKPVAGQLNVRSIITV